ncbi:MAG: cupredoxin domain-containing protein [Nanoarchaeota archaeon]|nr:cupredoxin domain-containing protein [Nanoarchaeota archaeon]
MKLFSGIVLVLMVFVSACAQQPVAEPAAQPSAPEPSPVPEAEPEPEVEAEAEPEPATEAEGTGAVVAVPEGDSYDIRYVGAGGFDPDTLTISAGSSVTFFNDDSKTMVIIVFKDGRNFATPRLSPGQQAEVEFTEPGEYDFWWNLAYATVGGKITVE